MVDADEDGYTPHHRRPFSLVLMWLAKLVVEEGIEKSNDRCNKHQPVQQASHRTIMWFVSEAVIGLGRWVWSLGWVGLVRGSTVEVTWT